MLCSVQFTHKKLLNCTSCPHLSILMILKYDSCNETYFHILTNDSCWCPRRCCLVWSPDSPWMFLTQSSSGILKSGCQEVLWLATRHIQIVSSSRSCHVIRDTAWQRDNGDEIMTGVSHLPRPDSITELAPASLDNRHQSLTAGLMRTDFIIVTETDLIGWLRWCFDNIRIKISRALSSSNQFNLDLTLLLAEFEHLLKSRKQPLILTLAPLLCQWIIKIEYKPRILKYFNRLGTLNSV